MARTSISSASSLLSKAGQKPPSSATPCSRPRSCHQLAGGAVDLGGHDQRFVEAARAQRHDHEILNVDAPSGMRAAAEDLDLRQRQRIALPADEIAIQRLADGVRRGVQHRHRHRDRGVAAQPRFVRRAVERDQRAVDCRSDSAASRPMSARAISPFTLRDGARHIEAAQRVAAIAQIDALRAIRARRRPARSRGRSRRTPAALRLRPSDGRANPTRAAL